MSTLPAEILEKILASRSTASTPFAERLVRYGNIGGLLAERIDKQETKPFLVFHSDDGPRKEYSFSEFGEEVYRTANYLKSLGVSRGQRIAVVSYNHADVVTQFFAAWLLGAAIVPVNTGEDDRRVLYMLSNSGASIAFVRDAFLARIQNLKRSLPALHHIIEVGNKTDSAVPHFQTEIARQPSRFMNGETPALEDEALIVYTSGTTGSPKGIVLDQYNLLVDAMAIAEWHTLSADQRIMCVLPLHHVYGIVVSLMTPLYAGASLVLNQRFHVNRFFERLSTEKVSVVSVVPTMLQFLLHSNLTMEAYKLQHFRHVICGGGPLTVELATKFEQKFNMRIVHGYGLSETTCYASFLPLDLSHAEHRQWMSKFGHPSIGIPLPINEMAIHDESGNELPEGEKGEIVIRGHNVMKWYLDDDEANRRTFTHGWFRSGDEGFYRIDEFGRPYFFITGRMKEIIIRGGVNISPFEIDEVLMQMPGVEAAIAVGFENDWYGEEVGACVKLKESADITAESVLAFCRKHLPFAKSPKVVVFVDELPVSSTGEVLRSQCEGYFVDYRTRQFST